MEKLLFFTILVIAVAINQVYTLDNGVARTPPMGWLSWTAFKCETNCLLHPDACINEKLYIDMADRLVKDGYQQVGYEFVNIDDCWSEKSRDAEKRLQADKKRFPNGIKYLADYMHKNGLKLGIYCDYGTLTCGGYPGSIDYLELDANTFASWEVDMLKMDGCYADISTMPTGYEKMSQFLNKTGRHIVYSCSEPAYEVEEHTKPNYLKLAKICNLWRNYGDIDFSWDIVQDIINWYDDHLEDMAPASAPGSFNDPDMIIGGGPNLSLDQAKAQFAIWSIYAAPLLLSVDLRTIKEEFKAVLLNKKVIDIDQDPLAEMGRIALKTNNITVYVRAVTPVDSKNGHKSQAIVFYNRDKVQNSRQVQVNLRQLGLVAENGYNVEDLFTGQKYGILHAGDDFTAIVPATGVVMLKATVVIQ